MGRMCVKKMTKDEALMSTGIREEPWDGEGAFIHLFDKYLCVCSVWYTKFDNRKTNKMWSMHLRSLAKSNQNKYKEK